MTTTLRDLLAGPDIVVAPGIYDGLTALLVERAGFPAAYMSGASLAYTRYAMPDIGLIGMSEVADQLAAIRERATLPIIVDIDTGFGNALNVARTVRTFETNGASALQLEDQVTPKRCGHLRDKALISAAEMVGKIKAALDARRSPSLLLIARSDAAAVEGLDHALARADAYAAAGADMVFVEAPPSRDALTRIGAHFRGRVPAMANMVEGGKTPILPAAELQALGFKLVIFPGGTVRALAHALSGYYESLRTHGTTDPWRDRMFDFSGLNGLLGTEDFLARGKRYDAGGTTT
ncbi:MAG: isocitrate lyase/phosphoenolpyruvate mutase family protein [Alphaproteobacteria bacterium]|nr:isocitrate lyase/phosphoenolpyruvate mutase family protein [Alphaproteobacteria bacterium]